MQSQSRTPGRNTPGRRRNANKENVYFEPGKYGRKTGLTLKDTGLRDEHGFEPASGIFSSPHTETPARQPLGMRAMMNSMGETIEQRRTPRMPPPRTQTPRRANIGGTPVRYSAFKPGSSTRRPEDDVTPVRPQEADYDVGEEDVVLSIERVPEQMEISSSAIAQAKRSRKSIFQLETPARTASHMISSPAAGIIDELSVMLDTTNAQQPEELHDSAVEEQTFPEEAVPTMDEAQDDASVAQTNRSQIDGSNTKKKRRSDIIQIAEDQNEVESLSSSKRRRTSGRTSLVEPSPSVRKRTSLRRSDVSVPAQIEESQPSLFGPMDDEPSLFVPLAGSPGLEPEPEIEPDFSNDVGTMDVDAEAENEEEEADQFQPEDEDEDEDADQEALGLSTIQEDEDAAPRSTKRRSRKSVLAPSRRAKSKSAPRSTQSRPPRAYTSEPPDAAGGTIHGRQRLRSTTPFEESGVQVTRSGRACIKPLAYWKNETYVWQHGQIAGIVRAEDLPEIKRRVAQRKTRSRADGEEDEEDDPEDLLPEAWEEEIGIINGPVRAWDAVQGLGSLDEQELKDVGFASRAIKTRDVSGGAFRYAKVIEENFFAAGVVELPPLGEKRLKNGRHMTMAFFVHEGKVTVDVAGMQFGVAKGGMWQVPRGNNYSISNESDRFTAKIFYAQGCEVEDQAETSEQSLVT